MHLSGTGLALIVSGGGGGEAEPVVGRLGFVEPMAKPTARSVFVYGGSEPIER